MENQTLDRGERSVVAMTKANVGVGDRGVILNDIDALYRFSQAVAGSALAPKDFIGKPESVMVAIQMGMEVGLTPMAALQNIAVINGRPSIWGDAQLAIVRSSNQLEQFEETETNNEAELVFRELCFEEDPVKRKDLKIKLAMAQANLKKDADDYGVSCFVKRRGFNEAFGRFTVGDAKKAGLWGKQGPWSQYPSRMLKFRARSFLLRDQFGDALKGMLTREEAQDLPHIDVDTVPQAESTGAPPAPRQLRRAKEEAKPENIVKIVTSEGVTDAPPGTQGDQTAVEVKTTEPVTKEPEPTNPPPAAAKQEASTSPASPAAQPTPSTSSKTATGGATTVAIQAKTPADWLPNLDPTDPAAVLTSLKEWMGFESVSEPEVIGWCVKRNLAKTGQKVSELSTAKLLGLIKQRDKVLADIVSWRPAPAA